MLFFGLGPHPLLMTTTDTDIKIAIFLVYHDCLTQVMFIFELFKHVRDPQCGNGIGLRRIDVTRPRTHP